MGVVSALTLGACGNPTSEPVSIVLITLDTTNPEALDSYGSDRGITPRLQAFAQQAITFDNARSVAPLTLPAHASMLTGLVPLRHGVRDNGLWALPAEADTLAERAQSDGYQTGAFVSAIVLADSYGLAQGFETFDQPEGRMQGAGEHMLERSASEVTAAAQRWLTKRDPERPFFLWVHYFDPHAPYAPPKDALQQAGGNAYLGEVAYMDREIGFLLDALDGEVGRENMLVCVVADHGESLGRHQEPTHSVFCYDATMRVPLLLRLPDGHGAGTRRTELTSVVDVFPTLARWLPESRETPGVDGFDLMQPIPADRGVYMESYCGFLNYGWSGLAGWADAQGKYLHSAAPEWFVFPDDPEEAQNLYEPQSKAVRPYQLALRELAALPRLQVDTESTDADASARMRAVGYAGAGSMDAIVPEPLDASDRPAPHQRVGELQRFYQAAILAGVGKRTPAIEQMREVLRENPLNIYAADVLAGWLVEEGSFEEARKILLGLLEQGHDRYTFRLQLGTSCEQLGMREQAERHFRAALEFLPGDAYATAGLQRVQSE